MSRPNWGEFERRQSGPAAEASAERQSFDEICARVFTTPDGRDLLKYLYALYVDRRLPPQAPDAALREAEAQRRLVADLETARDAGLERMAARAKR